MTRGHWFDIHNLLNLGWRDHCCFLYSHLTGTSNDKLSTIPNSSCRKVLISLSCFFGMPESVAMLECSLRYVGSLASAAHVSDAISSIIPALSLTDSRHKSAMTSACVGLASTLVKLVIQMLQLYASNSQQKEQLSEGSFSESDSEGEETSERLFHLLGPIILETVKSLDVFKQHQKSLVLAAAALPIASADAPNFHKLQTILLVLFALLYQSHLKSATAPSLPLETPSQWFHESADAVACLDQGLRDFAQALLLSAQAEAGGQERVLLIAEQYAALHFNGRLAPGCSHLGCTNLCGVSETALCTLLCSGCRRARYCSQECQKASWVKGGHSAVCIENTFHVTNWFWVNTNTVQAISHCRASNLTVFSITQA